MHSSRESVLKDVQRITAKYGFGDKDSKWGIKVDRSPSYGGGLGVFATRDFKENEDILVTQPYAHVTDQNYCDGCYSPKDVKKLMKCSRCGFVSYCSKECQTKMWPIHKLECKHIKGILPYSDPPHAGMMCLARMIYTHRANITRNGTLELIEKLDDLWTKENQMNLPLTPQYVNNIPIYMQEPSGSTIPVQTLINYAKKYESHKLLFKNVRNTMILPLLGFFNHHCIPNTYRDNDRGGNNLDYVITASRDIKCGEELFMDYTGTDNRIEKLDFLKTFLHKCLCSTCREINDTGSKEKYYRCHSCNGRVDIRWKSPSLKRYHALCLKCGKEYNVEELEKKGNIIKSNIKEEFNKAPLEIKEMMIKLYKEHFHVLDIFLAEELDHSLDKDSMILLNDPFVFKRIQLQLRHHYGPRSFTAYEMFLKKDIIPKLVKINPDLALYLISSFTTDPKPNLSTLFSNPDPYFDLSLL
ncbi:hypothetical protein CYY_010063 [Polysphondylium violaceum]|uniref:SET domain-containing protein n=1 Tax=Polysphondylium violaceum TaxID=133409 RepID=A0A8J4UP16_9MYCE|nr:hypothetical protein CYY_010063 [Polysphondylium violaceum]